MKKVLNLILNTGKKYYFLIFAVLAMVIPEIQLNGLVDPNMFTDRYVDVVNFIFTGGWITLIICFCWVVLPKKWGKITFVVISGLFIVLSFCEYVYFKIFNQFFWLKSVTMAGEATDYLTYAIEQIDGRLITCTLFSVSFLIAAAWGWRRPESIGRKRLLLMLVPIVMMVSAHIYMQPELHGEAKQWDVWRGPRTIYKNFTDVNKSVEVAGLYQFTYRNLYRSVFPNTAGNKKKIAEVDQYFEEKGPMPVNDYTGIFEGKNVIAVMMESMDTWMINKKYTPTIYKMMREGITFNNYNAPFFGSGFTLNSEFAYHTGYFTPSSAVSASTFSSQNFPYSLPSLFKAKGYTTNSFHFNDAEFYNRGTMHKTLGYEKYNSLTEFDIPIEEGQLDSNIFSNEQVYEKMVEKQPFYNFVVTYSAHLPYNDEDKKLIAAKEKYPNLIDENMDKEKNNAMILARDTDEFFKELLERLEADGLLENTVIIAFTDHFAYGISDQDTLINEWKQGSLKYRVPAFIYATGIKRQVVSKPMMTVDWAPTVVNLFNLNRGGKYIGNDILHPENAGFVYFETSSWIDGNIFYDAKIDYEPKDEAEKEYIGMRNQKVQELVKINDYIVLCDYYKNYGRRDRE